MSFLCAFSDSTRSNPSHTTYRIARSKRDVRIASPWKRRGWKSRNEKRGLVYREQSECFDIIWPESGERDFSRYNGRCDITRFRDWLWTGFDDRKRELAGYNGAGGDEPTRRRDFHNWVDRTRSCLVGRAVAATGASVFDFHGSHRRKLIILGRGRDSQKFRGKVERVCTIPVYRVTHLDPIFWKLLMTLKDFFFRQMISGYNEIFFKDIVYYIINILCFFEYRVHSVDFCMYKSCLIVYIDLWSKKVLFIYIKINILIYFNF